MTTKNEFQKTVGENESSPITKIIRSKKIVGRSFRLIDFKVYDGKPFQEDEDNSSDSEESNHKKEYIKKKDESIFTIQMYGINEKGESFSIFVLDYQPFFYVCVPDYWNSTHANTLLLELRKEIGFYFEKSILTSEVVQYNKLYGFTGGKKFNFVKLTFQNSMTMNKVRNFWYDKNTKQAKPKYSQRSVLQLYESLIPPLLRYFHIQNISPSGWVFIPIHRVITPNEQTTTCTYEYICKQSHILPLPHKETRIPYKICSFDIEASSSHGDFPIPIKTYKRLAVNIVDVYTKQMMITSMSNKTKELLEKIIKTAFGMGSFMGVELVFPKDPPSKQNLMSLIQQFLTIPIANPVNESIKQLQTIESLFENINTFVECTGDDDVAGEDDDDEDNGDDDGVKVVYKKKEHHKTVEPKLETTIINVLDSSKYTRDEKVQMVNDTLMKSGFPKLKGDTVTMIGTTFMRYGEPEPYKQHCIIVNSCDPIPNVEVVSTENESELLIQWKNLIQEENPDIIIGYNIFGFDYEFMFRRSQENNCVDEFLMLSRNIDEVCLEKNIENGNNEIKSTKMRISSGEYELRYPLMSGRLQIDMYSYMRRDYILSSYKLDDVAGQYISDDIKRIEFIENDGMPITQLYTNNLTGLHIQDYIHIEISGFTTDYYKNGHKFLVVNIINATPHNIICIEGHETALSQESKSIKWCISKDDVSPQDIFRLTNGSSADRAKVAKYCIQDCNLVQHLMNKIDVITGYVEMSRICSVPISFLVFRGQGIKLTSYVSKKCREKQTLMPDLEKSFDDDGYEGAIVLPPKCAMYMDNPVACLDYASLYPSAMISNNLSHDSKVWTKEYNLEGNLIQETGDRDYDNLPEYKYIDIEFDTFQWRRSSEKSRAIKTKVGKKICRWVQLPNHQKSILPSILEELLNARATTRKLIKTESDPFMKNILDKRQLGYKVTANSLYGQCGAKTSTFYEKDIAASTTATGRLMITYAKRVIEEVYGGGLEYTTETNGTVQCNAEIVYGDSVGRFTPVYVRLNGVGMDICRIEQLAEKYGNDHWVKCVEEGKQEKEYCELSGIHIESWSESGWTRLHRIIRHTLASHKKMFRILTHTGLVDVTDDHSLLSLNGESITPKDVVIGTQLLHHKIEMDELETITIITPQDAWEAGRDMNIKHNIFIPRDIMLCNYEKRERFMVGLFNGGVDDIIQPPYIIDQGSQLSTSHLFWLANSLGLNASINIPKNEDCYRITITNKKYGKNPNSIKKIEELVKPQPYGWNYVYDLTTENHHFAAGAGNMIVHNTDSVFFTFNLKDPKTNENIRGKKALEITIEIAQDAAKLCTKNLKPPMELTYEKTLMEFILLSKKRYVGILYETNPDKGKMKNMGLALKRRDSCDYLKDTYGGILNILMYDTDENTINKAMEFLDNSLKELIQGNISMDKLTITKALRSYYKKPQQIAHAVLADRIAKRDPGNKPKSGDRMRFIHVVNSNKKALQGEKIETIDFVNENKLSIDYTFYITNQLMKPLQQLFGLALDQIWNSKGKQPAIKAHRREILSLEKEFPDLELFMKKKEKITSLKVKELLFDKFLVQIKNSENRMHPITSYFQSKK